MPKYIDAEKLKTHYAWWGDTDERKTFDAIVDAQPAADVIERKRGGWIYKRRHRGGFRTVTGIDAYGETHTVTVDERVEIDDPYCPFCGQLNESVFLNFCPNCGADMRPEPPKEDE